ncbi:MAG: ParA family protein [Chloroflexota bacterium]|nr:ParA family protein [Chloroflexota bacterium]
MPHVLAFANQKGGVGKTTTTLNIGAMLAQKMAKVLIIDLDPQANLTRGLGINPSEVENSVYEVLLNADQGTEFATWQVEQSLFVVPSTKTLAGATDALGGRPARETFLRRALKNTHTQYDYILVDTPPNLGLLTANALVAATAVIVPVQVHTYALQALPELEDTVELITELNANLHIGGIVCTMVQRSTTLSREVEQQLREQYGELVFKTVIPLNTKLAEAPAFGEPISIYAPGSQGAIAYAALTEELETRYAR